MAFWKRFWGMDVFLGAVLIWADHFVGNFAAVVVFNASLVILTGAQ